MSRYTSATFLVAVALTPQIGFSSAGLGDEEPSISESLIPATRLEQSLRDTPGAVSIITQDEIRERGYSSIPEILRDIPGFRISYGSASDIALSYHGTSASLPHRMSISIDGKQIMTGDLRTAYWNSLPVNLNDIDRIVVMRGPNGATYGDNAFLASVDIIRKNPKDVQGTAAHVTSTPSTDTDDIDLRHAGNVGEQTHYSVSIGRTHTSGYDWRNDEHDQRPDRLAVQRAAWQSETDLANGGALSIEAGGYKASREEFIGDYAFDIPDYGDSAEYVSSKYNFALDREVQGSIYASYNAMNEVFKFGSAGPAAGHRPELRTLYLLNPELADATFMGENYSGSITAEEQSLIDEFNDYLTNYPDTAYDPVAGYYDEDTKSDQLTVGGDFQWTAGSWMTVAGIEYLNLNAESDTFFTHDVGNDVSRVFIQTAYNTQRNTINLGGMLEKATQVDDIQNAWRGSYNYHLSEVQTLRASVSQAFRVPSALEGERSWALNTEYLMPTPWGATSGGYYVVNQSYPDLKAETITSEEIGYLVSDRAIGVSMDLKVFRDRIQDPITDPIFFLVPSQPNGQDYTLRGAEIETKAALSTRLSLRLVYSYLENDSDSEYEQSLSSRHAGSLALTYHLQPNESLMLAYYGNSQQGGFSYDRVDLVYHNRFISLGNLDLNAGLRHYAEAIDGNKSAYESGAFYSRYKQPDQLFVSGEISF